MIVFPKSLSIRTQLFALVVAVLLPTVGVFLWFFSIDAHEAREAAHARAGLLAYSTATRVNEFLEGQRQILAALAQRPMVQAMDARQCDPVVAEHVHMLPGLGDVVVWDRRGNAICAYGKPVVAAAEVVSKAWFREGIEGGKFRVSDVMAGDASMPWVVMLTVPVLNGQGEAVGLISLPADLLLFSRRLFASLPVAAAISVVDRRRDFLMRSLMPEAFIGKPGPAGIIAQLQGQKEGTFSTDGVDGVRRLVTFVSIPSVDWMVFVGVPEGEVLAAIRARQRNAMVFGFAALLPMLLLAYLIARAIARPIQDLAVVSAKVAGGNLAARILPHGPDEIVAVAHQFNHMLDVRERSEAALTDSAIGLEAARQFTQATMDALNAHICVLDESGIIVSVNAAWRGADSTGAVPLQPIREGVNYCALCATAADAAPAEGPNYPHLFTSGLQQVLTRQCDHFAMEYPSPSAEGQLWFLARITRFRGDGPTRAVVAFENITDLKRAEERVVLSEHRLNLVLMGTNDGWWDWDLTTGQRFYSVRWWGMLGYEPDELSTADALDEHLMHPEDRVRFQRFLRSVLDGQEDNYEVEFRLLHKNGREVPLLSRGHILRNAAGRPIRVSGMNTDLTARKEAEQALRASEERWKLVLEGAGDGGWDWNIETNEVIHSRRWKAMLGYAENEVPDSFRAWSDLVYPPDMPGIMEMLQPHLEGRTPTYRHEYRMLCKDGTWKWILDRGTVVARDATGKPLRMVGTHIDLTRRKVVELALNETKERLARIFETIGEGLVVQNAEGVIIDCNRASERIFGLSSDEIKGRCATDALWRAIREDGSPFPSDEHPSLQVLRSGRSIREVVMGLAKPDGAITWISVNAEPLLNSEDSEAKVVCSFSDITARKLAEDVLRNSEEQQRFLIDHLLAGVVVHAPDGTILLSNQQAINLIGLSLAQMRREEPAYPGWCFMREDGSRMPFDEYPAARVIATQQPLTDHLVGINRGHGRGVTWVLVNAYPEFNAQQEFRQVVVTFADITDRKKAEDSLRASEERYRSVIAAMAEGIVVCDRQALIVDCNASAERILGRSLEQMKGGVDFDPGWTICREDGSPIDASERPSARALSTGRLQSGQVLSFRRQDDTVMWLSMNAQPLFDNTSTEPIGVVTTFTDVTDRRHADELRAARDVAELANRTKSAFLARMSHELRTPLNSILGFAQLLEHDPALKEAERPRKKVSNILTAGSHLLKMVDEILDLSRIEAGALSLSLEPVEVEKMIEDCIALTSPQAGNRKIGVHFARGAHRNWMRCDHTRLRQVVVNILSNAIKYNPIGGSVFISVAGSAGHVELSVRDTGAGLSAQQLNGLFQPFNRLGAENSGVEGTGIGLVIVKQLVQSMKGTIAVTSELGAGTTFTVSFPRAAALVDSRQDETGQTGVTLHEQSADRSIVLYVEDTAANVDLVRETLALNPAIHLEIATDGNAGLAAALKLKPDIILLDINLPGMDGFTIMRHLRANPDFAETPCIALSANAMPDEVQQAHDVGFTEYITKPFDVMALLNRVNTLLRERGQGGQ